ncbi:MAG: hypothetical protein M1269_13350 [Chloroflexi bacterium]|nr:hypothetical protein [Chloroflexota bacterium]
MIKAKHFDTMKIWLSLFVFIILCSGIVSAREFNLEDIRDSFGKNFDGVSALKAPLERLKTQYPNIKPLLDSYDNFITMGNSSLIDIKGGRESQKEMDDLFQAFKNMDKLSEENPLKSDKSLSSAGKGTLRNLTKANRDLRYWFRDYLDARKKLMWRYDKTVERLNKYSQKFHAMLKSMEESLYGLDGSPFDEVKPIIARVDRSAMLCEQAVQEKQGARVQKNLLESLISETQELSAVANNTIRYNFPNGGNEKDKNSLRYKAKTISMAAMEIADYSKMKLNYAYTELISVIGDLKGALK